MRYAPLDLARSRFGGAGLFAFQDAVCTGFTSHPSRGAHIAHSWLCGMSDKDGTLPDDLSKDGVHNRVDGCGLDANTDSGLLGVLVDVWAEQIEDQPDPRRFTICRAQHALWRARPEDRRGQSMGDAAQSAERVVGP